MIWRKQIFMLPLLLLLHVHGMEKILEPVVYGFQGLDVNNPNNSADGPMKYKPYHFKNVHNMMKAVKERIDGTDTGKKDGILDLFKDETKFDPESKPAQESRKKCNDALDAIGKYFEAVGENFHTDDTLKKGFKYLEEEAEYNDITTILSIASSMAILHEKKFLLKEKWDVTKLFQLNYNKRGTVASLTHDKYIHGFRRCLDKRAKGLKAFQVFYTTEKNCPGHYWDPEQEAKEDHVVHEGLDQYQGLLMIDDLTDKPTINGKSKEVFYDPVQAANELSHNLYWILRTWFAWYNGAGAMKQYLNPNDMRYSLASLANFGNGQLFLFSTLLMAADSFKYLNIVMTNDGNKLIIPKIPTNNSIYLANNFVLEAYRDLFVVSFIVAGTIAESAVIVNPLNNLPLADAHGQRNWKRFLGSLISTSAIFGLIFYLAAFAFLLASFEHRGGAFKKFDETCYKMFESAGMWTDLMCYETLAGQVMLFWLPGMDEGWTDPWMADSAFVGGSIWFFPGLLLKVFKIIGIEPMLLLSAYITRKLFVWLYRRTKTSVCTICKKYKINLRKFSLQQPSPMPDDISHTMHMKHNFTKAILQIGEAGVMKYSLMAVLMGIFKWKELYFSAFFYYFLFGQAVYYITDLLPTNNLTKRIAPVVAILTGVANFFNVILTMMAAGTQQGEYLPFISASGIAKAFLTTYTIITVLAIIVSVVLKWKELLWYHLPDKEKMAHTYMHEFAHTIVGSMLKNGQKKEPDNDALLINEKYDDSLLPKGYLSWFTVLTMNLLLFFWFVMRQLMHYHAGEFN